jgi:hypothetical protein
MISFPSATPLAILQVKANDIFSVQNQQERGILEQESDMQRVNGMQKILNPNTDLREEVPVISTKKENLKDLNAQPEAYRLRHLYEKIGQFLKAILQSFRKINQWIFGANKKTEELNKREENKNILLVAEPATSPLLRDVSLQDPSSEKVNSTLPIVEPQKSSLNSQPGTSETLHPQESRSEDNKDLVNPEVPIFTSEKSMQIEKETCSDQLEASPPVVKSLENPDTLTLQQPLEKTLSEANQDQTSHQISHLEEVKQIEKETNLDKSQSETNPTVMKEVEIPLVLSVTVNAQVPTPEKLSRAAQKLIDFFHKSNFKKSEGVFRISADKENVEIFYHYLLSLDSKAILPNRINYNGKVFAIDANLVVGTLRKIYKEIDVFGNAGLRERCIEIGKKLEEEEKKRVEEKIVEAGLVADLKTLVNQLNRERKQDLQIFIDLLREIEKEHEINKMTISNLAISINDLLCSKISPTAPLPQQVEKKSRKKRVLRKIQTALHLSSKQSSNESLRVAMSRADLLKLGEEGARIRKLTEYLITYCEKVFRD